MSSRRKGGNKVGPGASGDPDGARPGRRAPPGEEHHARRGRFSRLGARARSRPWAVLVISNVLPLTAAIAITYGYYTGKINFVPGAGNVIPSLVALGVLLAVLVFLSWLAAPILLSASVSVRRFLDRQTQAIARGGVTAFVVRFPPLVAGTVVYAVLWLNAAILGLLVLLNLIAILVCLAFFVRAVFAVRGG